MHAELIKKQSLLNAIKQKNTILALNSMQYVNYTEDKNTALHLAIENSLTEVAVQLVPKLFLCKNKKGETARDLAIKYNNEEVLKAIDAIEMQNVFQNKFENACKNGDLEAVKYLLPKIKTRLAYGNTPLILACMYRQSEIVDFLPKKNINAKNDLGETALHKAYDCKTVRILLEAGADYSIKNNYNQDSLYYHAMHKENTLKIIKEFNTNIVANKKDIYGFTPIDVAKSRYGSIEALKELQVTRNL